MTRCLRVLALLLAATHAGQLQAAARLIVGPTPITDGEAIATRDITILNDHLAFAIAVDTPVPYGVPRGALIDVAPVIDGAPGRDRIVFADFIPNNWSAWPNTYQKMEIVERGPQQVVVKGTRDWGRVTVATTYTLRADADRIELQTTMTNNGDTTLIDLLSGQTLWPSAGHFFAVPGLDGLQEGRAADALADRATAYDEDWAITLHAPYFDRAGSDSMDLFLQHTLKPGESRSFDAWLQVGTRGDLGPVLAAEIERKRLPHGTLRGVVTTRAGKRIEDPVVVIERNGVPYAWSMGRGGEFTVQLPLGDYRLHATAKGHSQSRPVPVRIAAGTIVTQDFRDLDPPGRVDFEVVDAHNGHGLDARIVITQGQQQVVEFLGRSTFFTELDRKGQYSVAMAPGDYGLRVSSGGGFLGPDQELKLELRPGQTTQAKVAMPRLFNPPAAGWYSADLHHHADQAEGVTPPEYLARSQLAAGLDLLFVSDHDSTANHALLQEIAERRGVPFIASMEISPSWGHFNAWPLQPHGRKLAIDTSTATVDQVFGEARRQGAIVVQANHPFIPYGYLASVAAGVAPGGFNPAFDLAEINGDNPGDDVKVLRALWDFWNSGQPYYLTAGTDVHDVWNHESGEVRLFARADGVPTPSAFAAAVKAGHAYVSYGPLIEPSVLFGCELKLKAGVSFQLGFTLRSVPGLKQARLIGAGAVVATETITGSPREARISFPLTAAASGRTWYSLEVEDAAGRKAYTNPIWVDVVEPPDLTAKLWRPTGPPSCAEAESPKLAARRSHGFRESLPEQ
jgi:hypothetical protein